MNQTVDQQRALAAYHEQRRLRATYIRFEQEIESTKADCVRRNKRITSTYSGNERLRRLQESNEVRDLKLREIRNEQRSCRRKLLEIKQYASVGAMLTQRQLLKRMESKPKDDSDKGKIDLREELREIKDMLTRLLEAKQQCTLQFCSDTGLQS